MDAIIKMVPANYEGRTIGFVVYYPDGQVEYVGDVPIKGVKIGKTH